MGRSKSMVGCVGGFTFRSETQIYSLGERASIYMSRLGHAEMWMHPNCFTWATACESCISHLPHVHEDSLISGTCVRERTWCSHSNSEKITRIPTLKRSHSNVTKTLTPTGTERFRKSHVPRSLEVSSHHSEESTNTSQNLVRIIGPPWSCFGDPGGIWIRRDSCRLSFNMENGHKPVMFLWPSI